ncbi:MAG: hypothetical protein JXQ73_28975 [Phycisphaerae bacterium]|nr:hypothetical protein [Phycisphaerae bacterium]
MKTHLGSLARLSRLTSGLALTLIIMCAQPPKAVAEQGPVEPTAEIACGWWRDLHDYWTPIGWKDHPLRFNVLFNGTIIADTDPWGRLPMFKGLGVQLTVVPSPTGGYLAPPFVTRDTGGVLQGWMEADAPILWSEWSQDGIQLREEIFAHLPGGGQVETGREPLFAWVRLSVAGRCDPLPLEPRYGFAVKINAPHLRTAMAYLANLTFVPDRSAYPRALSASEEGGSLRLIEPDGKVRLGIAPGSRARVSYQSGQPTPRDAVLTIVLDTRVGEHVDLLVPAAPAAKDAFDAELAMGRDRALDQANRYWSIVPATAARIDTPEGLVNDVTRHSVKFSQIISEKHPESGEYALLSGSLQYAALWATPFAMNCTMLLDGMGYHDFAARHLEIFRNRQGTVTPPGDAFKPHPGYLSSPKSLTSIDWLSDHGALLYAISEHALLSGDADFTKRWLPSIVKACEFIRDARSIRDHKGYPGIMPPAVATDAKTRIQAVWNDGWIYKGLCAAVRVMKRSKHPQAGEFAEEARAYREAFQKALRDKTTHMPRWKDAGGRERPLVPTSLYGDQPSETRHVFYLDTGPLFLVFSGLVDAEDELMEATRAWFRQGPQTQRPREEPQYSLVPFLRHEMSSWEPCYSWNVFHSHALPDRRRMLEGMYSLLAGSVSRRTFISCETRGGITGNVFSAPLGVYLARLAMVDDQIAEDELHLLRVMPLAWLRADRQTRFENIPTEFGPVTVRARLGADRATLAVSFASTFRIEPRRVVLHVPPYPGLAKIEWNGAALPWNGRDRSVVVPITR